MTFEERIYFFHNFVYNQYNLLFIQCYLTAIQQSNFKTEALLICLKQYKVPLGKIMSLLVITFYYEILNIMYVRTLPRNSFWEKNKDNCVSNILFRYEV